MHAVHCLPIGVLGGVVSSEKFWTVKMRGKGVVVGTCCPAHPLQDTTFLETGEEIRPIHSLQPARSQLQAKLSGGSVS